MGKHQKKLKKIRNEVPVTGKHATGHKDANFWKQYFDPSKNKVAIPGVISEASKNPPHSAAGIDFDPYKSINKCLDFIPGKNKLKAKVYDLFSEVESNEELKELLDAFRKKGYQVPEEWNSIFENTKAFHEERVFTNPETEPPKPEQFDPDQIPFDPKFDSLRQDSQLEPMTQQESFSQLTEDNDD